MVLSQRQGLLRLTIGAVMISFSPVWVRLSDVPPTTSAFYRVLIGGVVLLGIVKIRGRSLRPGRAAWFFLILAGLSFSGDLATWHRSINYLGPGLSTLLASFQVFVMAIAGAMLYGQRMRLNQIIAVPAALFGLAMIVGFDWKLLPESYRWGVILGLMTAFCFAGYMLSLRHAQANSQPGDAAAAVGLSSIVSAFFLLSFALGNGESLRIDQARDAGILLAYALGSQVIGWVLISSSLQSVRAVTVGIILLLEPLLAFVWDVLFFDRAFSVREATGAAIALAAIFLASRSESRPPG